MWLTLLCPTIPLTRLPSCSLASCISSCGSSGCPWKSENNCASLLGSCNLDVTQLGIVAANGRQDTWRGRTDWQKMFWIWTKSISKVLCFPAMWTLVGSSYGDSSEPRLRCLFLYVKRWLACMSSIQVSFIRSLSGVMFIQRRNLMLRCKCEVTRCYIFFILF